jgi:methyl-accepting chemotaxis protein
LKFLKHLHIIKYLNLWSHLKISKRIFYTFVIVLGCTILLTMVNFLSVAGISRANQKIKQANEYRNKLMDFTYWVKPVQNNVKKFIQEGKIEDQNAFLISVDSGRIQVAIKQLEPLIKEMAGDQFAEFQKISAEVAGSYNQWSNQKNQAILGKIDKSLTSLVIFTQILTGNQNQQISSNIEESEKQTKTVLGLSLFFNSLILILLAVLVIPLLRELRKVFIPVYQASDKSLEGATDALNYTVQVNEAIAQLKVVTGEMGRSIEDVACGAQDSSAQAQNVIAVVKVTTDFVRELADKASSIYESLASNQADLEQRVTQIQKFSGNIALSMGKINKNADTTERLAVQLTALEQELAGVEAFLAAMNDLSDQTNLLALNASIEAARAKDYGRGFAVVANRIRNLSEETKQFTSQIQNTITGLQQATNEVGVTLREVIMNTRGSTSEALEVNQEFSKLEQVLGYLYKTNENIIESASLQMDRTRQIYEKSREINISIENISNQTEQVSASMQELTAEGEEIIGQIELISDNVNETKEVVERQVDLAKIAKETAERF